MFQSKWASLAIVQIHMYRVVDLFCWQSASAWSTMSLSMHLITCIVGIQIGAPTSDAKNEYRFLRNTRQFSHALVSLIQFLEIRVWRRMCGLLFVFAHLYLNYQLVTPSHLNRVRLQLQARCYLALDVRVCYTNISTDKQTACFLLHQFFLKLN